MSLVANSQGIIEGKFTIPAGIPSGSKRVEAIGAGGARGVAVFTGQGTIERQLWQQQTTITETRWTSPPVFPMWTDTRIDPLAQTFTMEQSIQAASVEVWFAVKPTTTTMVQIRETTAGLPNQTIVATASLEPDEISAVGTTSRFDFNAPVLLMNGVEYAIVVMCNDPIGECAVAELGKFDSDNQRWITSQAYTVGVLLSSSNASTWTAHQDRDLAFRILAAQYTETERTIPLGKAAVVNATDLILMAYADRPASVTNAEYVLTFPDASTLTVADGQPVQLPAPITGDIQVAAKLSGDANFSPVLYPDTQLVAGQVETTADYVTRAVPGGSSVTVKAIYEAVVPSGATVTAYYKGIDAGDTWAALPAPTTRSVDDGFVEFYHTQTGVNESAIQIKLVLSGTTAARPRVRDLRVIVM